jgi:hypothetical protein
MIGNPIQDYGEPFIRRRNLQPAAMSVPPMTGAAGRLSGNGAQMLDDRTDLLKDAENAFYSGGNAQSTPTPTPTPSPRLLPEINRPRYRVSPQDLQMYGAGADYGFTA